ncbi:2'-5' RNA ligase family protein [Sphingomonas radiodurans]|uniref:2'-5' RNA ligase family protein n=1 Tax=Sphingomonas radiodurans TaxID=2890321 RepID=UPI001E4D55F6|nr:2'-5' RNA ligase family protein [Sphingomonas radiodurans]WBH16301.1 2'-5' RNA ligase family protein [Sphingomonas radiodurans]
MTEFRSSAPAPIIVTALLGKADQAYFDELRRAHFPPERNHLDAHLTMFHHLPPSTADEVKHRLTQETRGVPAPEARLVAPYSLGRGVAYRIDSPGLAAIRAHLAEAFAGLLTPQDQAGWRAHVTVQNKVEPKVAKSLLADLASSFQARPLAIAGLAAWWYRGGPWEPLSRHMFAG